MYKSSGAFDKVKFYPHYDVEDFVEEVDEKVSTSVEFGADAFKIGID